MTRAEEDLEFHRLTIALFGSSQGRAWLIMARARAARDPAYQPGETLDLVAWRAGKRDGLDDIARLAARPLPESPQE